MQQACCDGSRVHLHFREHLRDFERMNDVRLARGALLPVVLLHGEVPRGADQVEIVMRTVAVHSREHVLEAFGK